MAYTFDAKFNGTTSTTNPTTHSITAADTIALVVVTISMIYTASARTGGSPTFAGTTMLLAQSADNQEVWYLENADAAGGTNSVSIPNSGFAAFRTIISTYTVGAGKESSFIAGYSAGSKSATLQEVSVGTATSPGLIVDSVYIGYSTLRGVTNNGTLLYGNDVGTYIILGQYKIISSTGAYTTSYDAQHSSAFVIAAGKWLEVDAAVARNRIRLTT